MEFILGITDLDPRRWRRTEPNFESEQVQATDSDSYLAMLECLSNSVLVDRRAHGDHRLDEHLWNLKICSLEHFCQQDRNHFMRFDKNEDSEDESEDESEKGYRGCIRVSPKIERQAMDPYDLEDYQIVEPEELLSAAVLQQGHILHFEYDYGTTTNLYLKVLQARSKVKGTVLRYITPLVEAAKGNVARQKEALERLPAYNLAKEDQIDAAYPHFSRACVSKRIGQMTWGLSSRISSLDDTTWCSMSTPRCVDDLFFSSQPFANLEEFLSLAEEAWSPNPEIESTYRRDYISRLVFPADTAVDQSYNNMVGVSQSEAARFGPKMLFFRRKPTDKIPQTFDFAKTFPLTHAHFTSGKFRWFQYRKGALRVLVGRGCGHNNRSYEKDQVLETWLPDHFEFSSLHEILCAVEVSWSYNGAPLIPDKVLCPWDNNYLSPSNPPPPKPKVLAKEEDAVAIWECNNTKKKAVVVLEIVEDANGKMVLYSGHVDGTLNKWCLETNNRIWEKQVFHDCSDDYNHCNRHIGVDLNATGGVAGMVIRSAMGTGRTEDELYVWTDGGKRSKPSKIKCLRGSDAEVLCIFRCRVVGEVGDSERFPSVATVVLAPLCFKEKWMDAMVVGLHCIPETKVQENGLGNIVPFHLPSQKQLKTWRGHTGIINAMAVIHDIECLVSVSMQHGTGHPDAMILWDLKHPGVLLHRLMFWDPKASLFEQQKYRLDRVFGIGVSGGDILLCDHYGDRVVAVRVESKGPKKKFSVRIVGYAKIGAWPGSHESEAFHGTSAMCDGKFLVANEYSNKCWLFDIASTVVDSRLDTREGNPRDIDEVRDYGDDYEEALELSTGRQIALGLIEFPAFGGNKPKRKRRRIGLGRAELVIDEDDPIPDDHGIWCLDTKDGNGNGGATAHAIFGRWIVAGFLNGSILRSQLPAEAFDAKVPTGTSSGLVSCSRLPSDFGCARSSSMIELFAIELFSISVGCYGTLLCLTIH